MLGRLVTTAALLLFLVVAVGPLTGQWRSAPVLSGSMTPRYPVGSLVFARPMPSAHLTVGDVILFQAPEPGNPTVMHRIAAIEQGDEGLLYRTKGDANTAIDPWLLKLNDSTAWRVHGEIPVVGKLAVLVRHRPIQIVLLLLVGSLVVIAGLSWIWRPAPRGSVPTQREHASPPPMPPARGGRHRDLARSRVRL
jgi:signal peptidase